MKRKVNRVGQNTLTVSLPAKWAKKYKINPGDEIDILEDKERIILGASNIKLPKRETTINIPTSEEFLGRILCAPYIKGYDIINVTYNDSKVYDKVLETSRLLIGFEVMENTSNSCKLVSISTKLEQNFEVLLVRLFISSITFTKELYSRLKSSQDIKSLLEYEFNTNRLALFCKRSIHTNALSNKTFSPTCLYNSVSYIEESADAIRDIIETIGNCKIKLNKHTMELFEKAIKIQENHFTAFNQIMGGKEVSSLLHTYKEHQKIRKPVRHDLKYFQGNKTNSYICSKLLEIIELSHHVTQELYY